MMPMFQQGSRAPMLLGFGSPGFARQTGGFTYNDSPYVHALNRTLQLEQAAISLYSARIRSRHQDHYSAFDQERHSFHHNSYRQLVRLIFAQRGLPDSDPISFTAVTSTLAVQFARWMPEALNSPMLLASAHHLEAVLIKRYDALLKIAPESDQEILRKLSQQTRDFLTESL